MINFKNTSDQCLEKLYQVYVIRSICNGDRDVEINNLIKQEYEQRNLNMKPKKLIWGKNV